MCLAKKDAGCKGGQCTMVRVPSITQTANQVPQPRPPLRTCTLRRRRPFSASWAPPFSSDSPSACRNGAGVCISKGAALARLTYLMLCPSRLLCNIPSALAGHCPCCEQQQIP